MKKIILIHLWLIAISGLTKAQTFSSVPGQEAAFNAKYELSASIDEKTMTLKWSTDAPIVKAILSVYTKEQLAKRKGIDHRYPFRKPVYSYEFNLNAPAYKGFYAYWLKVYTSDGLWQEYFFRKKEATVSKNEAPKVEATTEEEGYTIIKTTVNCEAGKQKITNALKDLDGVFEIKIDTKTGRLALKYSSDGTPYTTIIETILNNGFDADGQKSTKASLNPCKRKG
jgi:copper chaperone CopZ